MKTILSILVALCLFAAPSVGQIVKALSFNTSNGVIVYTNTNVLTFNNPINLSGTSSITGMHGGPTITMQSIIQGTGFRAVLASSTNLINNAYDGTNFYLTINAIGTNVAIFRPSAIEFLVPLRFNNTTNAATTRTNLGLGATNIVTFAGLTNNGDIRINQTATNNGLLYVYRTNSEAFLGLANLIASNNTTISNETLFRVGVSEDTNKAAQFGFRATNTNGNGVAVFSVFGFNALMQIGADASTNAVIYSGGGTNNEVMTLIKDGATEFARPIAFKTADTAGATRTNLALGTTNDPTFRDVSVRDLSIVGGSGGKIVYPATNTAPADTTNVVSWIQVNIGTNAYRVPLYQ